MDKVNILYEKLENNIPFCFIKLNDGEVSAVLNPNSSLSRGDENSSIEMSEKLKECFKYNNENYYIGLPCSQCYPEYFFEAITQSNERSNRLNANILINTNIDKTIDVLTNTMKGKNIVIVTNYENSINLDKLEQLNIIPYKTLIVSKQNAFTLDYERIKDEYKSFNDGDVVICLCGPLGRVLCYEWFKQNNTLTCLELGSIFDPLLKNKAYLYHTGTHKYCVECYPSHDANDCKLLDLSLNQFTQPIYKECYYFNDKLSAYSFYNYNIIKIKKNNEIRLEKDPYNVELLKLKSDLDKLNKIIKLELNDHNGVFELDNIIPRQNNKPFYIVYHISIVDPEWIRFTYKSFNKLLKSGILYDEKLKGIKISYLGEENNITLLKAIWNHPLVEIHHFGNNIYEYEYPAINLIKDICSNEDCNIFYFHCKGLIQQQNDWIEFLEYFNIDKYKYCLDKLIDYDTVGCNYYNEPGELFYIQYNHHFTNFQKHYSGNFWWSKSSHINTLARLVNDKNEKYSPKYWICKNEPKIWSYYTSPIDFGKPHDILTKNVYEGLEHLDFNFYRANTYKHLNKDELYDLCRHAYGEKKINKLDKLCDIYLGYFKELDDDNTQSVKFWSGYANYCSNPKKSKRAFIELLNSNITDVDRKNFTCYNLDSLYPKNNSPIPKIIHLIYFKGIDFVKYHYACVLSILKHMPNYKIIIYNDEEPVGNEYWDKIKRFVTIEKTIPPSHFDDFPLKYIQYKADVIRLEKLYEHGGIYLDLDMLIVKNFESIINNGGDFYISHENTNSSDLLINCFLASKPKNGFILKWLETFKSGLRMNNWAYHIRNSNKLLLDKNKHYMVKYNIKILNSEYFLPFKWEEREKFIHIKQNLTDNIHGIHLFETILHNELYNNTYINEIVSELDT